MWPYRILKAICLTTRYGNAEIAIGPDRHRVFGNMGPEVSPRDSYGDTGWLTWGRETRSTFSGLTGLFFDIDKNGLFIVLGSNCFLKKIDLKLG